MSGTPARCAMSRAPASSPSASRGSAHGSSIAQGNGNAFTSPAWSSARPKDGPTLGIIHTSSGAPAIQPSSSA
jgi:hypothetical protein